MKKLTAVILTLCMLLGLMPTAAFAVGDEDGAFPSGEFQVVGAPDADDAEAYADWKAANYGGDVSLLSANDHVFSNDYLEVCVHPNGQFTMGTTGGDPENARDNNKYLLFGHGYAYTSETVVRINGVDYFFQGNPESWQTEGLQDVTVRTIAGVEIKQILTPVDNPMTGRSDIVKIQYECKNTTNEPKTVGVRIMLDTMLGDNDGAPFRVGTDQVTWEKEYTGNDIPRYWLCFDYFDENLRTVTSTGTLYTNDAERPDKVQFANWPNIIGSSWNYQTSASRYMYDTAVAVYFNPTDVAANQTKAVTTYYGISETVPAPDPPGELAISVVKPAKLSDAGNGDYENNPFDITAYVKNTGGTAINNVKINLDLTGADALELVQGGEKEIKTLAAGQEEAAQWTVQAKPQKDATTVEYRVTGDYDGQSEQTVVDLKTELDKLAITHTVTFQAEGEDPIYVPVADGGSLAESEWPAVPPKAGYSGSWNADDVKKLENITADITVNADYIAMVRSVAVEPTGKTLTIGEEETVQLTATVLPAEAPDKSVTWSSYNESVATVDANGLVKAVAVGTATIEAKSNSDPSKVAVCAIKVEAVLTGIEVNAPNPWEMIQGDPLDITGLEVWALYSDTTKFLVTDYTLTGYDPNPEGLGVDTEDEEGRTIRGADYKDETLTITYEDFQETCTVRVKRRPPTLSAISISRLPNKRLNYVQGEKLNLDGMQVNYAYSDGTMSSRPVEFSGGKIPDGFIVTGYDPTRVGNQAITLSYGGKSMQFSIRVLPGAGPAPSNVLQPRVSVEAKQGYKLVSLSHPDGFDIYYTTDGSTPTVNSPKYKEPFEVEKTTTVKAVAVSGGAKSPLTSMQVYLPKVEAPMVANVHHRNRQGLNGSMTELEPGTLVSLISDTAGASIYYWIEGKLGSAENSRYGTSIYMKPEYADANNDVVVKAYATKDGYENSDPITLRYHLNIPEVIPEIATISVGSVTSQSGLNISTPLLINSTTTRAPGNAMVEDIKIQNFSVSIQYDSGVVAFQSVSPLIPGTQIFTSNTTTGRSGVVTVRYNGAEPLALGEVCALNFRVEDSTEDNDPHNPRNESYDLKLDQTAVSVNLTTPSAMIYDFVDGLISIVGAHNSQLAASTTIVDASGTAVSSADALEAGEDFMANVTIALPEGDADAASLSAADDDKSLKVLNVFMVIYDNTGAMVSLESWDIDVTDPANLQTVRRIRIPKRVPGGRVRFMLMSEDLAPSVSANTLTGAGA